MCVGGGGVGVYVCVCVCVCVAMCTYVCICICMCFVVNLCVMSAHVPACVWPGSILCKAGREIRLKIRKTRHIDKSV